MSIDQRTRPRRPRAPWLVVLLCALLIPHVVSAQYASGSSTNPTLTVRNTVLDADGNPMDASGWDVHRFGMSNVTVLPETATTDSIGEAVFQLTDGSSTSTQRVYLTVVQREGFALQLVDGALATCSTIDGPLVVSGTANNLQGFMLDLPYGKDVECEVLNRAVPPDQAPTPEHIAVTARAGGDRLADGSVAPLAGAAFDFYATWNESQLTGGELIGRCTTGENGTCRLILALDHPYAYAFVYAVQTGAPAGWSVAQRWGSSTDLLRYNSGRRYGGASAALPGPTLWWPSVRDNPALPGGCGLDIGLSVDLSNLITGDASTFAYDYIPAATWMVDVLEGTPTSMALYPFATDAPAAGAANTAMASTPLTRSPGADAVRSRLESLTATPTSADGYRNWDKGLHAAADQGHDVLVLMTAGAPDADRDNPDGYLVNKAKMANAMFSANAVKAGGTRVIATGIGGQFVDEYDTPNSANWHRLALVSSTDARDAAGVNDYAAILNNIATTQCGGTVNVVKDVRDSGGTLSAGDGIHFRATVTETGTVATGTTDTEGAVSFDVQPEGTSVTVEETSAGYQIEQQGGANAVCTANGNPVTATNTTDGFTVPVAIYQVVVCNVINTWTAVPGVSIVKTSSHDHLGSPPAITSGETVTWTYTVTNTGTVDLTDLQVTDDQVATVTCPDGNGTILVLQPGQSVECTATGPVTALNPAV